MTLKKMNERSPKETIKVAGNQKEDATYYKKPEKTSPTYSWCTHQHHREKRDYTNLFQPGLRVTTPR